MNHGFQVGSLRTGTLETACACVLERRREAVWAVRAPRAHDNTRTARPEPVARSLPVPTPAAVRTSWTYA
jgi:hypothetical protein